MFQEEGKCAPTKFHNCYDSKRMPSKRRIFDVLSFPQPNNIETGAIFLALPSVRLFASEIRYLKIIWLTKTWKNAYFKKRGNVHPLSHIIIEDTKGMLTIWRILGALSFPQPNNYWGRSHILALLTVPQFSLHTSTSWVLLPFKLQFWTIKIVIRLKLADAFPVSQKRVEVIHKNLTPKNHQNDFYYISYMYMVNT